MNQNHQSIIIFLIVACISSGCLSSPEPNSFNNPGKTLKAFFNYIKNEKYSQAYSLLSKDTQKRYKQNHFWAMMKRTQAGKFLRWKARNWRIKNIQQNSAHHAWVILSHPNNPDRTIRYELIRDKSQDQGPWKIRYFLADDLHMPRSDEKRLFNQ